MADLRELQRRFFAQVTGRGWLRADHLLDGAGRIGVYAEMYKLRLRDALAAQYPVLAKVLGDEFAALAERYLRAHPSTSPSLRELGRELPDFLDGWHADLAALEWARNDVFDGPDDEPLSREALAGLGPEGFANLKLSFAPNVRLVPSKWGVREVWADGQRGNSFETPAVSPGTLIVWRQGLRVYHRRLDPAEARLLSQLDCTFGALCENFEDAAAATEMLARWVDDGLLAR
jgi:hypothetical protein